MSADAITQPTTAPTRAKPRSLREFWAVLTEAADDWQNDNAVRLAAAVSMYTILSLAPLLVITIKAVSLILSEEAAAGQVRRQVEGFLGSNGAKAVEDMIVASSKPGAGTLATVVSLVLLLFTASGVFVEVRGSLNALWKIDPKTSAGWLALIRERLLSFGMVFAVGFLLLVSQFMTTAMTAVSEHVVGGAGWVAVVIDLVASTVVITLLFTLLFRFLPDARVGWRYLLGGSFVTAVLFKIGQYVQALYFTYISTGSAYGAAGSFVVVMTWVYYSAWILFFGAELIKVYAARSGHPIRPNADGKKADPRHPDRSVAGGV